MANAWVFNSNTGNFQFDERKPDDTLEDQENRKLNIKNRLFGVSPGLGQMFTATEGGVQKTYAPGTQESVASVNDAQKNLPKTVSTGRRQELTDQERELRESLKGIEGTTASSIMDRFRGLQTRLENTQDLGAYSVGKNTAKDYFSKLLAGETNINDVSTQLSKSAKAKANKLLKSRLGGSEEEYEALLDLVSQQEEAFKGTGISNLTTEDIANLSPKAQEAYMQKLSRLRGTGLSSDVRATQDVLQQALGLQSESELALDTLKSSLGSQASRYGTKEIGKFGEDLATDYNKLLELAASQEAAQKSFNEKNSGVNISGLGKYSSYKDIPIHVLKKLTQGVTQGDSGINANLYDKFRASLIFGGYSDEVKQLQQTLSGELERRKSLESLAKNYGLSYEDIFQYY